MNQASILIFLTILLSNCNGQTSTVKDPTKDLTEGKIVYTVSGESTTSSWELEIFFNPKNAVIKEKYARGAGRKYIYNKPANEILGLIDDAAFLGIKKDSYFIYYSQEDFIKKALSSNYGDTTIFKTQEYKDILGYKCQKLIIKHGNQVTVEVWITDKIKTGIIYPWTPLVLENLALEYEIKILGRTDRKYVIKSISDEKLNSEVFKHKIPDEYYLVVPASVYSISPNWNDKYEENKFQSFKYPYLKDSRESTINFLKEGIEELINKDENINIEITIDKSGELSEIDISINYSKSDERIDKVKQFLKNTSGWTSAKVEGESVKSKVAIFN